MGDRHALQVGDWVRDQRDGQLGRISRPRDWRWETYYTLDALYDGIVPKLWPGQYWDVAYVIPATPSEEELTAWTIATLSG